MNSSDIIGDARRVNYLTDSYYYDTQTKHEKDKDYDMDDPLNYFIDDDDEDEDEDDGDKYKVEDLSLPKLANVDDGYHVTSEVRDECKMMLEDVDSFMHSTRSTRVKSSSRNYHERLIFTDSGIDMNLSFEHADEQYEEIDYSSVEIDHSNAVGELTKTTYVMETQQHIDEGDLLYYSRGEYLVLCSKSKFACGEVMWQPFYELWGSKSFYSFKFKGAGLRKKKVKKEELPLAIKFDKLNEVNGNYRRTMYQVLLWTINMACDSENVFEEATTHYWRQIRDELSTWSHESGNKISTPILNKLKSKMKAHDITLKCYPEHVVIIQRCNTEQLTVGKRLKEFPAITYTKVTQVSDSHSELGDCNYIKWRGPGIKVRGLKNHDDYSCLDSNSKYQTLNVKSDIKDWRETYRGYLNYIIRKYGHQMVWNCDLFSKKKFFSLLIREIHDQGGDPTDVNWNDVPLHLPLDELSETYKAGMFIGNEDKALWGLVNDIITKYLKDYIKTTNDEDYVETEYSDLSSVIGTSSRSNL